MQAVTGASRAAIFDIDGTVSPIEPEPDNPWGEFAHAGHVFGPALVAPALCARLDALAEIPGVSCWWLTSWSAEMRQAMHHPPFPGRGWPAVAEQLDFYGVRTRFWKLTALETWIDLNPAVRHVAWADDHLRGGRVAAARRRLAARGVSLLTITPRLHEGLTPRHVELLEAWARAK